MLNYLTKLRLFCLENDLGVGLNVFQISNETNIGQNLSIIGRLIRYKILYGT